MNRLFLAAGVAAIAIAAPAAAGPHGGGGGPKGGGGPQMQAHGGGNPHGGGGGGGHGQQARPQQMQRMQAPQMRAQRQEFRGPQMRAQRQEFRGPQMRAQRQEFRGHQMRAERQRPQQMQRMQARMERHQARPQHMERRQQAQNQRMNRQQMRMERVQQAQNQRFDRQQVRIDNQAQRVANNNAVRMGNSGQGYGVGGCPPGLASKGCMPPGLAKQQNFENQSLAQQAQLQALQRADALAFQNSRLQLLNQSRILAPTEAMRYLGAPLSTVSNYVPLAALPQSVSYLYPDTNDYYYRYGDGYLYQVDRGSNLISSLLPLLGGGYLPGTYLPQNYMSSYVPDYYGLSSFYPSSYGYSSPYAYNAGYGYNSPYSYANSCNRYVNGVIYQVDCGSGLVQNVVPTYAGGYGVGQMLPSAYNYYNVPTQYRSMYYPTSDANYWYAPGAIYQVDPASSMITSVAALLSPGFSVGQPLPAGYDMYNVPMAYRSTYYDTPNAWYRYNNGNIYQVDPTTQLVTAIVASLLT